MKETKQCTSSIYECYLNGEFYSSGPYNYMVELFKDYLSVCEKHKDINYIFTIKLADN